MTAVGGGHELNDHRKCVGTVDCGWQGDYLEPYMHALRGACAVTIRGHRHGQDTYTYEQKHEGGRRWQQRGDCCARAAERGWRAPHPTEGSGAKSTALQQRDKMDDNCAIRQGAGGCVLRACMHSAKTTSVEGAEYASPHSLNGCPHPPSNCPPFSPNLSVRTNTQTRSDSCFQFSPHFSDSDTSLKLTHQLPSAGGLDEGSGRLVSQ